MALHFRGSVTAKPRRLGRASVDMYIRDVSRTCVNGCFRDFLWRLSGNRELALSTHSGLSSVLKTARRDLGILIILFTTRCRFKSNCSKRIAPERKLLAIEA